MRFKARGRNDGAVALEAMLSIVLLFVAFFCMWGAALIVYNQSRLNTAAQLAAQSGVIIFDRSTYRGINPSDIYARAIRRSKHVAYSVYKENTCGMLPDQFTGEKPNTGCYDTLGEEPPNFNISIQCSPALEYGYTAVNCYNGGIDQAQALRVRVQASTTSPFDFLAPLASIGASREPRRASLESVADAFSFAAEGKIR